MTRKVPELLLPGLSLLLSNQGSNECGLRRISLIQRLREGEEKGIMHRTREKSAGEGRLPARACYAAGADCRRSHFQ